jgi:type II secretory pathway predicted ATPase ExeA
VSEAQRPSPERVDPFLDVPDPARYVPRDACDLALAELAACVRAPARTCAVVAPPGLGKTLLLHTVPCLVPELESVYVPNPVLGPADLCAWTLGALGSAARGDPIPVLVAFLEHLARRDRALGWLLDDAHGLPAETARWLRRLADSHASLRLVLCSVDRVPRELGEPVRIDALARPMTRDETRRYLEQRLLAVGAGDLAPAEEVAEAIHRESGGVPRAVSACASALLWKGRSWTSLPRLM